MSAYNLFSQLMSYFCRYSTCFIVFIPRPVTTSFDWFFVFFFFFFFFFFFCCGSGPQFLHSEVFWDLSGSWSFQKGNRTETGPDFKALSLNPHCMVGGLSVIWFSVTRLPQLCNSFFERIKRTGFNSCNMILFIQKSCNVCQWQVLRLFILCLFPNITHAVSSWQPCSFLIFCSNCAVCSTLCLPYVFLTASSFIPWAFLV